MNIKYIAFLIIGLVFAMPADAIKVATGTRGWWGYDGGRGTNGTAGDFIIAGSLGKGGMHGTHNDEWAVIGLVANTIVEHGGYFCPYQVQCANKRKKRKSWTMYYHPNGFSSNKCAWLCEPGFGGTNCLSQTTESTACDNTPQNTSSGGKFSGISMKTSGGNANQKEWEITGFNQWGSDPECDVILGVVKYLEHGVIAGPVQVCCGRDNWKNIDSFVNTVSAATGNQKLLCATGYTANATGSDCEPVNPNMCETQGFTFCANFDRSKYTSEQHTLEKSGSCYKYFCSESGTAFPSVGDTDCTECATGVKGGSNPNNGVCVVCETGQYFDKATGQCKSAAAYTKVDLQYGKGQTRNTLTVNKQCWTKATPDEYRACVSSGAKEEYTASDNLTITGITSTVRSAIRPRIVR